MKKKVYCHNCIFYIPKSKKYSADGYTMPITDGCCSPNAVIQQKVKDTYKTPAHTVPYFLSPELKNRKNDCKDYSFGIHKDRLEKKKPWWKFW